MSTRADDDMTPRSASVGCAPEREIEAPRLDPYDLGAAFHHALSLTAHAVFLAAAMFATPPLHADAGEDEMSAQLFMIQQVLAASSEREMEVPSDESATLDADGQERSESRCGSHDGGSMGDVMAKDDNRRYGVRGPHDNPDPHISRDSGAPDEWYPFMGPEAPRLFTGGAPLSPNVPWGRDDSLGNDDADARAHLWGEEIAAAFGSPGVGMGVRRLCETCGDSGKGVELDRSSLAREIGTESTAMALRAIAWGAPEPR